MSAQPTVGEGHRELQIISKIKILKTLELLFEGLDFKEKVVII